MNEPDMYVEVGIIRVTIREKRIWNGQGLQNHRSIEIHRQLLTSHAISQGFTNRPTSLRDDRLRIVRDAIDEIAGRRRKD